MRAALCLAPLLLAAPARAEDCAASLAAAETHRTAALDATRGRAPLRRDYAECPPLGAAITVYGGSEDPVVTAAALGQWRQHTAGAFAQAQFVGGHFYLQAQRDALLVDVGSRLLT